MIAYCIYKEREGKHSQYSNKACGFQQYYIGYLLVHQLVIELEKAEYPNIYDAYVFSFQMA